MKMYAKIKLNWKLGFNDSVTYCKIVDLINKSLFIHVDSGDSEIYFTSNIDGDGNKVPFICEISDYKELFTDAFKSFFKYESVISWSRKYTDLITKRHFIHHEKFVSRSDTEVYNSGKSNLGEYLYIHSYIDQEDIIPILEKLTKEDVKNYKKGLAELESIIRECYFNIHNNNICNKKSEKKRIRKNESYINKLSRNISK